MPTSRRKALFFFCLAPVAFLSSFPFLPSIHIIRHNNAGNVIMTSKRATKEGPRFLSPPPSGYSRGFECSFFFHSLLPFGASSWKCEAPLRMKGKKNA